MTGESRPRRTPCRASRGWREFCRRWKGCASDPKRPPGERSPPRCCQACARPTGWPPACWEWARPETGSPASLPRRWRPRACSGCDSGWPPGCDCPTSSGGRRTFRRARRGAGRRRCGPWPRTLRAGRLEPSGRRARTCQPGVGRPAGSGARGDFPAGTLQGESFRLLLQSSA